MQCAECGCDFYSEAFNARFCNVNCKQRFHDKKARQKARMMREDPTLAMRNKDGVLTGEALETAARDAERQEAAKRGVILEDFKPSIDYTGEMEKLTAANLKKKDDEK